MILSENELELSDTQIKLIGNGWGNEVLKEVSAKRITYEAGKSEVKGYLVFPKNTEKKYPLIIWNRGGNGKDGMLDDFLAQGILGEIASWGYVVLASQYREDDEFGGTDVDDVLALIPLAKSISFCDTNKIGMEGWSRGGMMTYLVLSRTVKIKCSVIISGLADLFRSEEIRSDLANVYGKLFGSGNEELFKQRKKERSAVHFADKISKKTKILLIHGTSDKKVSYNDSEDMYKLLQENGVKCELKLIEGGDHYLRKNRKEVLQLRKNWFEKYLKNGN